MNYLDYKQAVEETGSLTAAAEKLGVAKETFRQRYQRMEEEWLNREKTIVVIPDSHSIHGVSNDRFEWAGHLCRDVKADVVVDIGDWADMESLCSYDKGTKSFEGRRYKKDISVAVDARERFDDGLNGWQIDKYACLGNHENRINKVCEVQPEFDGVISVDDLQYKKFGWKLKGLGDPHIIDGIAFSHYFPSGVMNRPIGGENHAASLIKKCYMSCVCGHSHLVDHAERVRADGARLQGLVVGCYFDHYADFAGPSVNKMYRSGIFVLRNVKGGEYDYEFISMNEMKKRYV